MYCIKERKRAKMQKKLNEIMEALNSITKRLSALEKGAKTTSKKAPKTSAKKEVFYFDITTSGKVNKRNLKSLESSYHYNKERYGKTFKESFKTFNDFKKSLDSLGSIKTRDRVYYTQQAFNEREKVAK